MMTEQIKSALLRWADKVFKNESDWDAQETHVAIQRLYEISVHYKLLNEEEFQKEKKWSNHQAELKELLDVLNPSDQNNERTPIENSIEVPPLMDTIKNMVSEMPDPESYENLFESVSDTPTFVVKNPDTNSQTVLESIEEKSKNINDLFDKKVSIDLNDRLTFIKYLFDDDVSNYERVLSQIVTFNSWEEVKVFINEMVKPEYQNWNDKAIFEERFMSTIQNFFSV